MRKKKVLSIAGSAVLALLLLALPMAFLFADRLASFFIDRLTDYRITYQKWGTSPFNRDVIFCPQFEIKSKGIKITADKARIGVDGDRLIKRTGLAFTCELSNATFKFGDRVPAGEDIFDLVLGPGRVFGKVRFSASIDSSGLTVTGLTARSQDIRIEGDYYSKQDDSYVSLDMKISISEDFASMLDEKIRTGLFTPDEEGWYGMRVSYEGAPAFLKALYMITSSN